MIEIQKERFQHLLANSILEMWKKETGSSLSVTIEGTICITSPHGRVTVIQISSQFPGLADRDVSSPADVSKFFLNSDSKVFERTKPSKCCSPQEDLSGSPNKRKFLRKPEVTKDDNNNELSDLIEEDEEDGEGDEEEMLDVVEDRSSSFAGAQKSDNSSGGEDGDMAMSDDDKHDNKSEICCAASVNDSAVHDLSGKDFSEGEKDEATVKEFPFHHHHRDDSDLALSSPLIYTTQVHNAIQSESVLKNHLLSKSLFSRSSEKSPISPDSEPTKSPVPSPGETSMFSNRAKFPMWPIKKELTEKSAEEKFAPLKHSSPVSEAPNHFINNSIFPGFIPAAHTSNINNYLRLHSIPSMINAHHSSTVKELANRSFSVPVFSPTEERSFDLAGRNPIITSSSSSSNRADSSSAPVNTNNGEQKIYKCLFCHKTFLFKSKYHEHLPVHTSARPFQCHLCNRTYKYKYDLRVHLRTHLGIPTKSTICPFCSNKFATNKQLRLHIRDEHNEQQRISDEQCAQSLLMALPSA